jgi:hypothetical protein
VHDPFRTGCGGFRTCLTCRENAAAANTVVYVTEHAHSQTVGTAFAMGGRMRRAPATELLPGAAVFYGILRGCGPLLHKAIQLGRDFYFVDNGYLKPGHYHGYYRATKNAYQHRGEGRGDFERLRALDLTVSPWQKGAHVVVCPPGEVYCNHHGMSAAGWLQDTLTVLSANTDREIRVRKKGSVRPLAEDLKGAHALVTHASNAAVEAIVAGVPAFVTGASPARAMGNTMLREIERPVYGERMEWLAILAANQWTLDEFRAGTAWAALNA